VLLNQRAYRSEPGKVLPELLRLLEDKHNQAHAYIVGPVIGVVGPNSTNCLPALIRCLQATDPGVRREAAVGLEQIGPSAKAVVPDLTAALQDPDLEARIFAARALWRIDRQTNSVAPVFEKALKTLRPGELQTMTAVFLSDVNPDSPVLLPVFVEALTAASPSNSDYGFRSAIVVKLRRFGPSAQAAVPVLVRMINEKDILSHLALQTLQKIDPEAARQWATQRAE
jgi:HEAT repeat protein